MVSIGSGVDFDSSSKFIDLPPKDIATTVSIPVMCDRLIEGTEMFDIRLDIVNASHSVTTGLGLSESTGVIEDSTG